MVFHAGPARPDARLAPIGIAFAVSAQALEDEQF
jgi:hypothetical protein